MLYIILSIFSFIIGCKFAKTWNLLQVAYFKRQIDISEIEEKTSKKYRQEIKSYQEEIYNLRNKLENFREYKNDDFEEVLK